MYRSAVTRIRDPDVFHPVRVQDKAVQGRKTGSEAKNTARYFSQNEKSGLMDPVNP